MILGETLEQQRFFEQALAGREDLLGRRADGAGTGDGVMPTRWVGNSSSGLDLQLPTSNFQTLRIGCRELEVGGLLTCPA